MKSVLNDTFPILFSDFLYKAYVVGTPFNCVPTTYVFIKK